MQRLSLSVRFDRYRANNTHMDSLFSPFQLKSLKTRNRFVMSPMTRSCAPDGIPTQAMAQYYRRRAGAEVGLIISEGTAIGRPAAVNDPAVPHFYGTEALCGWQQIIDDVKAAGGQMAPQLWHAGIQEPHSSGWLPSASFEGPAAMSDADIADTIAAFGAAAANARRLGFNCVELQGAHGYLIDQFFWHHTNTRNGIFGGSTLSERSRFAVEVIREVRRQTSDDFTLLFRFSQWRFTDVKSKLAKTPQELEDWLLPLADAGVDIFHCSTRRFSAPEFSGSDLGLAGWAKKLTGKATITVGSVGLDKDVTTIFTGETVQPVVAMEELQRRFDNNEFDLVAVGRPLLADPHWVQKVRSNRLQELQAFEPAALSRLS